MKSGPTDSSNSSSNNLLKYKSAIPVDQPQATSSTEEEKKKLLDYSTLLGTVENKETLSREVLLQVIYQFMSQKGYHKTIKEMERETGVKYNGFRSEKSASNETMVETLLRIGITNAENPYQLPSSEFSFLNSEIPTASIHHHYDPKFVKEMQIPLWEELSQHDEDSIVMEGNQLKAATLNRLIEMVASSDNKISLESFLVTYRSFTDPAILLKKLCERYLVPNYIAESEKVRIQLRTGAVFSRWIEDYFSWDWNEYMVYEFLLFIDKFIMKDKKMASLGEKLKQKLAQKMVSKNKDNNIIFSEKSIYPEVPKNIFYAKLSIWDIKDEELARQLTFIDHNIYRNIEPHEFLDCAWSKPHLRHRAKNILKSISFVETLNNWFECEIVREKSLRERKNKLSRLMKLAILMYNLNNFNSLMALSSAYNKSSVLRLKLTIAEIDETLKNQFFEAISIVDPNTQKNFSKLRSHMKTVAKPPLNVFLGVYQTYLIMTEEGNQDFTTTSNNRTLINWKKRMLEANIISEVMVFKNPPYNINPVPQIQELIRNTFENHQITDVYDISLLVEPRGVIRKELLTP